MCVIVGAFGPHFWSHFGSQDHTKNVSKTRREKGCEKGGQVRSATVNGGVTSRATGGGIKGGGVIRGSKTPYAPQGGAAD